ncbi:WGxxGxxG family protein [Paenibacillus chartarius]|uniref:WGxxGxxG family protein n=1 Tax=Paenibacillus chartarius TaxID=747481 RepID=A0ABV6DL99_9BACL
MKRKIASAAAAAALICQLAGPVCYAEELRADPVDRSETNDVNTSGISGVDQRSIIQTGPSATDWMGLSRSPAYWVVDDRDATAGGTVRTQGVTTAQSANTGTGWGWLGLLGLVGVIGLFSQRTSR